MGKRLNCVDARPTDRQMDIKFISDHDLVILFHLQKNVRNGSNNSFSIIAGQISKT